MYNNYKLINRGIQKLCYWQKKNNYTNVAEPEKNLENNVKKYICAQQFYLYTLYKELGCFFAQVSIHKLLKSVYKQTNKFTD